MHVGTTAVYTTQLINFPIEYFYQTSILLQIIKYDTIFNTQVQRIDIIINLFYKKIFRLIERLR